MHAFMKNIMIISFTGLHKWHRTQNSLYLNIDSIQEKLRITNNIEMVTRI